MKVSIILDDHYKSGEDRLFPIKVRICIGNGKRLDVPTNCRCRASEFVGNAGGEIVNKKLPTAEHINLLCNKLFYEVSAFSLMHSTEEVIEKYTDKRKRERKLKQQKEKVKFSTALEACKKRCIAEATVNSYKRLGVTINRYFGEVKDINDVDVKFIHTFDDYMIRDGFAINTRAMNKRLLRAVINKAIDDEIYTKVYPFRKIKIKTEVKEPRTLTVEQVRQIINYQAKDVNTQIAKDLFLLSFYLCGINLKDLHSIKKSEIIDNTLKTKRKKTQQPICIGILPQTNEIAERYSGNNEKWLAKISNYNYKSILTRVNRALKRIAKELGIYDITFYSARYSWATIADSIGIEEKTISKALGHADRSIVGRYYIRYNWEKVSIANKQLIEFIEQGL